MSETHMRNTGPMQSSPRCGAKTRKATLCQAPAVSGKARCRMHGGAKGSGAPLENRNAFKHGDYTHETQEFQKHIRELMRKSEDFLEEF